jgi:hypothetical protein
MSDVFSFGPIRSELLTGQSVFSKELTFTQIAFMLSVNHEVPDIPEFILPSARELITECWREEPGVRPSCEEIMNRLMKMKVKVMLNVNSSKLSIFIKEIEGWESQNRAIRQ